MWVWVTFAYLIPAVAITLRIFSPSNTRLQRPIHAAAHERGGWSENGAEAEVL
jgi:hypothetical protein